MKKLAWVVMVAAVLCVGLLGFAQSMSRVGKQSVLLILPEEFHEEELVFILQQFVNQEADIYVTSVDTMIPPDVDALKARIPERFFNLQPLSSGGPRVTVISSLMSFEFTYDKAISLGAGWYDSYYAPSGYKQAEDPSYTDGLYWFLGRQFSNQGVVGAIGAGAYPLIFSGVLPPGTTVPAYPCPDLVTAISDRGYEPKQAPEEPRQDGAGGPPLVTILSPDSTDGLFLVEQPVNGGTVVMTPIPNSWYPAGDGLGALLISDYAADYVNLVDAVENAAAGVGGVSSVQISHVNCGPDGMVSIRHVGESAVNLAGWKLQSVDPDTGEVLHEYTFGDYTLEPGADVHVYYGMVMWSGPENYVHWGEGVMVPEGGRVQLVDPQGHRRSVKDCP